MGGAGFMWDMVEKVKENLSRLPSKQPKNKLGSKFMKGWLPEKTKRNGQKLKDKKISESELAEVMSKIRFDAQQEKRRRRLLLAIIFLIVTLVVIAIIIVFVKYMEWYWSGGRHYFQVK